MDALRPADQPQGRVGRGSGGDVPVRAGSGPPRLFQAPATLGSTFLGRGPPLPGWECVSVSVSVLGVCGRRSPEPRDSSAPEQWSPAGRAWPGATSPVAGVARAGRGSWKGSELATASRAAGGEADASRGSGFPGGPGYRREK